MKIERILTIVAVVTIGLNLHETANASSKKGAARYGSEESTPDFASAHHTSVDQQNQMHFKATARRAGQVAAHGMSPHKTQDASKLPAPLAKVAVTTAQSHSASAGNLRRHTSNPPTGKLGFVSAIDIPAGGASYWPALSGDFNGDGKTDIVSEVENYDATSRSATYSISVVLSNGDGTFKPAVLTPITNNDQCATVVVGDLNNDGKSDLIVVHQPGACGNSYSVSTFDVLLSNGDGTFMASANTNNTISTSDLSGGTLADVNADGKLDIVVVDDASPANVWTLLGNGDGTFQAATSVTLSGGTGNSVIVADLNGDGVLDVADNDYYTNQLTIYLATSATTYAPATTYLTSDGNYNACYLAVGDLSGDGKPELINANCSSYGNDITIYVNNGDGTFATGVYYDGAMSGGSTSGAAGGDTCAITIADVNRDGKADIIASNDNSSDLTVLLGNGNGTVTVPDLGYAAGGYLYTPAVVADFNGDGLADLIVSDGEFSFAYLKGYGDGTFRSAHNYYADTAGYSETYGVATGDFNGDGHPDFVVANYCYFCTAPLGITVFLSRPDGSLQPGVNYGTSNYSFVAVADFNGDGKLDIAATDYGSGTVQLFNGDGAGNFTMGSSFATDLTSNGPYGVFVGDFNKDGHPDLAIANWNTDDIAILLNDGTGNFPTPAPIALNGQVWQGVAVGDINGDGKLDLVVPYWYGGSVAVLLGNGDGTFQAEQDLTLTWPDAVTLADFNGDGKLDMAVTLAQGDGIAVALGNGDGTFGSFLVVPSSMQNYSLNTPFPENIQAVDVDGDGKVDLVYVDTNYGTIGVLFGQGNGTFFDPVEYPGGQYAWALAVADVNGDGAPDVVTSSGDFAGASVLLNSNGSATQPNFALASAQTSASVTAGDSATYSLVITPTNSFNGTISFSCGTLPSKTTCTFQPSTVVPNGNGQWSTQLTIGTTASTSAALHRTNSPLMLATFSGIGVFGMLFANGFKKNRMGIVVAMLVLVMMISLVGCAGSTSTNTGGNGGNGSGGGGGGSSTPGTPSGSYTVVVTASGANGGTAVSHTINLSLTVQ
ncbi:MAG TPA: VCBS repeat-containing protein [Candidatus Sulfotelmatobacter sp.]|nr:VCBS repeat-containing protein [Candidatus Sulfotelmatobacter sp.]